MAGAGAGAGARVSGRVRVLLLEDKHEDADLVCREVRLGWAGATFQVTADKDGFLAGLLHFQPDVILSDHVLPRFTALEALALSRRILPDVPFIVVTHPLDEETAVECMKAGAADYVLKENLRRLVPGIARAMEGARARQLERLRAELHDGAPTPHEPDLGARREGEPP